MSYPIAETTTFHVPTGTFSRWKVPLACDVVPRFSSWITIRAEATGLPVAESRTAPSITPEGRAGEGSAGVSARMSGAGAAMQQAAQNTAIRAEMLCDKGVEAFVYDKR
jgi:hypothetical protein